MKRQKYLFVEEKGMTMPDLWKRGTALYDTFAEAEITIVRLEGEFVVFVAEEDGNGWFQEGDEFRKQKYSIVSELGSRYLYADEVNRKRYGGRPA